MIFYGHRFEDNCCILRVVVLQGDELLPCEEVVVWGGGGISLLFPSLLDFLPGMFYYQRDSAACYDGNHTGSN